MTRTHEEIMATFEAHAQEIADVYGCEDGALESMYARQAHKGIHTYCECECGTGSSRGGYCCTRCVARAIEIKETSDDTTK